MPPDPISSRSARQAQEGFYDAISGYAHEAEALIAQGSYFKAFVGLRRITSDSTGDYPLKRQAAEALRHAAARFAMGGRIEQQMRLELLEEAAPLYREVMDFKSLRAVMMAQAQAHLALGETFPAALAAQRALDLSLARQRPDRNGILRHVRFLADTLEATIDEIRNHVTATQRAVRADTEVNGFDRGRLIGVKALAYRVIADGLPATMPQMTALYHLYSEAAERYHRAGNANMAFLTQHQGILIGMGFGLPKALEEAMDRLILYASQIGDTSAIIALEHAIQFAVEKKPEDAKRVTLQAARTILGRLEVPVDLFVFHHTAQQLAEHLWNELEEKVRLNKDGPAALLERLHQQVALGRQQYALWYTTLTAVKPLVATPQSGHQLVTLVNMGLQKLQGWAEQVKDASAAIRHTTVREPAPTPSPQFTPELIRMIAATDWSSPIAADRAILVMADALDVPPREVETALLPGLQETPLAVKLRAELHPYTFGRASSALMEMRYTEFRDRWEFRER